MKSQMTLYGCCMRTFQSKYICRGVSQTYENMQMNKLVKDYEVDLLAGCETRTDWQVVTNKEDRFCNLFGNGQPALGTLALNIDDPKIKRDQLGVTCLVATG
jgi:hypothetical protein